MPLLKKFLCLLVMIWAFLPTPAPAAGNVGVFTVGSTEYLVNGKTFSMDVAPFVQDGRTFIPVRYAAAVMGVPQESIAFDSGEITLTEGDRVVKLRYGSNLLEVNGVSLNMDVDVLIVDGRTMLPVRWVGLALGAEVAWDGGNETITITGAGHFPGGLKGSGQVDPVAYAGQKAEKRDYNWEYNGRYYTWHVEIPVALLDYDRKINSLIDNFYSSDGYEQHTMLASASDDIRQVILSLTTSGDYTAWAREESNSRYSALLAGKLAQRAVVDGYDYFQTAEFVQSFVGGAIAYELTDKPILPGQTLAESGDCKDKSILLAALLRNMGYRVALLFFPPPPGQSVGHMAVGIAFTGDQLPPGKKLSYYTKDGRNYYFAETTRPNWKIGEISDSDLEQNGSVYVVD
jgi:hypothetical protein